VHVVKPGLLTTVQDLGRWGFQALGVSVAGPMDPVSHRIANAMAGNAADAAALEATLIGPELVFDDERLVAVAGAEFEISIDHQSVVATGSFVVPAGATLRFGRRLRGHRYAPRAWQPSDPSAERDGRPGRPRACGRRPPVVRCGPHAAHGGREPVFGCGGRA
jgi:hypothetical protein